jgi:cell wall-associated NlpC family hydrolase
MTPRRLVHCLLAAGLTFGGAAVVVAPHAAAAPVVTSKSIKPRVADAVADQAQYTFSLLQAGDADIAGSPWSRFDVALDGIAEQVAARLGADPAQLKDAWHRADVEHQRALLAALSQLGVPYRHNTSAEGVSFDCSGLTAYAWARAGVALTRQSRSQITAAAKRTLATAQAGDLVYYPGHVMMYLGIDAAIVHSPQPGRYVEIANLKAKRARSVRVGDPTG